MIIRSALVVTWVAVCVAPSFAFADDLVIPGIGLGSNFDRPSYREAVFPPPQHNAFGLETRTPLPSDRPSYREEYNNFPPASGRYGGGFLEYVMTGGRPEPVAAPALPVYAAPAAPAYAAPSGGFLGFAGTTAPDQSAYAATSINPRRASLPRGGLPDYVPSASADGTPAGYAAPLVSTASIAQPGFGEPVYPQPATPFGTSAVYDPSTADSGPTRQMNPTYERQMVAYSGRERPGTIIIDTPDKFLYLVQGNGQAIRYGIGVGRPGFAWSGVKAISRKAEWPEWTPPSQMLKRRPDLPRHMAGGEANPLGARAMYLGSSLYRIHGTNEPYTIGTNVSSGCIRMMNTDVIDLYGRVDVGTRVVVM